MEDKSEDGNTNKELILVLPNTFFHNAFRFYPTYKMNDIEELEYSRFIVNFVIQMSSVLPENKYLATTTETTFETFIDKLNEGVPVLGTDTLLAIFSNLIYIIKEPSINKLNDVESIVAVAHRLYSASSYEPIIIVNQASKQNFYETANKFLNLETSNRNVPFKIYDSHEAKAFLDARFPLESSLTLARTDPIFKTML